MRISTGSTRRDRRSSPALSMSRDCQRPSLLHLLGRFHQEGVEYVLVGGQAVRLNGYVRATEDIDSHGSSWPAPLLTRGTLCRALADG